VSVRPKKVSWRKLIGLASCWTQSSRIEEGRHGGGMDCRDAAGVEAVVANVCDRRAGGRHRMESMSRGALWGPASMLFRPKLFLARYVEIERK